ncbi:hypothetical protein ACOZXQ_000571 [Cronobacter malonaticus]
MATTKINLTDEWQQITTGSESVFIQSRYGKVAICDSPTRPDDDTPWVVVSEAGILPPASIWVKSFVTPNELVVLSFGN